MAHFTCSLDSLKPLRIEVRGIEEIPALVHCIESDDISCETLESQANWHWIPRPLKFVKSLTKLLDHLRDYRLKAKNACFREERTLRLSTKAMMTVINCAKCRLGNSELIGEIFVLVPWLMERIKMLIVIGIVDMKLVRTDSDDWA